MGTKQSQNIPYLLQLNISDVKLLYVLEESRLDKCRKHKTKDSKCNLKISHHTYKFIVDLCNLLLVRSVVMQCGDQSTYQKDVTVNRINFIIQGQDMIEFSKEICWLGYDTYVTIAVLYLFMQRHDGNVVATVAKIRKRLIFYHLCQLQSIPELRNVHPNQLYVQLNQVIPSMYLLCKFNAAYICLHVVPLKEEIENFIFGLIFMMIAIDFTFAITSNIYDKNDTKMVCTTQDAVNLNDKQQNIIEFLIESDNEDDEAKYQQYSRQHQHSIDSEIQSLGVTSQVLTQTDYNDNNCHVNGRIKIDLSTKRVKWNASLFTIVDNLGFLRNVGLSPNQSEGHEQIVPELAKVIDKSVRTTTAHSSIRSSCKNYYVFFLFSNS